MTKQFNVGDTIQYTSPFNGQITKGLVKTVQTSNKQRVYNVTWDGNNEDDDWITGSNLSLFNTEESTTIIKAKELKAELESEILRLIGDFNKKTNLEVQDIDLDCYRVIGGGCFYQVNVKVEI